MRIGIIGSGVAGIVAARTLMQFGHEVVVLEQAEHIGGVWRMGYPGLRLQNVAEHYRLGDFPWPFTPDEHPTAPQVRAYLEAAVAHFQLDVRLRHRMLAMEELPDGWRCQIDTPEGPRTEIFDRIIVATGQFTGEKAEFPVPGRESFTGTVITERDLVDVNQFNGLRVAVIGFGKTALDLATMAGESGATEVHHVFRTPRWLIPRRVLGRHIADTAMMRTSGLMTPGWVHSMPAEAFLHRRLSPVVAAYWRVSQQLFRRTFGLHTRHRDARANAAMRAVEPDRTLVDDISLGAIAPERFYPLLREGRITPHRASVTRLTPSGLELSTGENLTADVIVLAIGAKQPTFPFLPARYRSLIEGEPYGAQFYRHVIHPLVPRVAFAGFNDAFMFIQCVEISMLWYGALLRGDIALPPAAEMLASTSRVMEWKLANSPLQQNRAYHIGHHVHQYVDVLLRELCIRHRRKPSFFAERFESYYSRDYAGLFAEYEAARANRKLPAPVLPFDT